MMRTHSLSAYYTAFILMFTLALSLALFAAGCGGGKVESKPDTEAAMASPKEPAKAGITTEKAVMITDDGVAIYGTFTVIDDTAKHPAVILCHQFRSDRGSYEAFQKLLAENGISSLAIDFRGFGESTDNKLSYENFKDSDYMNMLKDISAAMVFLTGGPGSEKIDPERIGLAGASIGANLAIIAGAELEGIKCIAALSPGRSWHGLEPLPYAPKVTIPVLVGYATGDKQSAEVIPDLQKAFTETDPRFVNVDGSSHGTNLLLVGFDKTLLNWLKENL